MIPQLQQIFHSITKSLEVLYVMEGNKPCARILVFEDEFSKVADFLKGKKLNYASSGFKVVKQSTHSEFYSDKSVKIPKNSAEKGYFFLYISKSKEIAEKAKAAEENNDHLQLGIILGYPGCCCEFFVNNFSEKNTDLTLNVLNNSNGFKFQFYTNVAARHFDISLLSHFPHSFGCRPSIKIAKSNLKIIRKNSKQLAGMFSGIMRSVVAYTLDEGIFLMKNYEKTNNKITYGDVIGTAKSKLYFLLSSNHKLEIMGTHSFAVSDIRIEGPQYGIMVFT